jgi:hypothetical protein
MRLSMEPAVLLPLAAFIAIAAAIAVILRRAGRIVARTREVEGFRSSVRDLSTRIDTSLEGATARIDAVRRHQVAADTITETISAATDAVERYTDEARALHGPPTADEIRDDLVAELERAGRALAMVEHGAGILAQARRRGRELEAQTSIKRGYLNLLHAREAIARHAARALALDFDAPPTDEGEPAAVRDAPP